MDQRAVPRAPARRPECERDDAREPGSVSRQARPLDGPGGSGAGRTGRWRFTSSGISGSPGPRGWRRSSTRRASIRPPRPNGSISSAPGAGDRRARSRRRRRTASAPGRICTAFVMIAELTGCEAVNEALPRLADRARSTGIRRPESGGSSPRWRGSPRPCTPPGCSTKTFIFATFSSITSDRDGGSCSGSA